MNDEVKHAFLAITGTRFNEDIPAHQLIQSTLFGLYDAAHDQGVEESQDDWYDRGVNEGGDRAVEKCIKLLEENA